MNTPYIMVCVERPEKFDKNNRQTSEWTAWYSVLDDYSKITKPAKGVSKLVENVWLFDLSSALTSASELLHLCRLHHADHKAYLLSDGARECL